MRRELVRSSADPALIPEAAHKLAEHALREHERALRDARHAVAHAVKSGEFLIRARELCDFGQWRNFFEMHFRNKLALRTAQKYMRLAKNWPQLAAQCPAELSSQQQAAKAITAILSGDEGDQPRSSVRTRAQVGASARGKSAQVGASASAPDDVPGPVWRASGPFVREALTLVTALETSLNGLLARGYPLESEAERAQEALDRLRAMINGEMDEAGALPATGQWSFVTDNVPPTTSAQPRKKVEDDRDN